MVTSTSLLFVIVAAIAVAVTVRLCRHTVARGRAVRWWLTGVGIVFAAFLGLLFVTVPDIFKSRFWAVGQKAQVMGVLFYTLGFNVMAAFLPAVATVWYYRVTTTCPTRNRNDGSSGASRP